MIHLFYMYLVYDIILNQYCQVYQHAKISIDFSTHHLVSSFWNTGLCLPYPIMGCFKSNFILVGKRRRRRVIATCELKSADLHITSKGIQALNNNTFINHYVANKELYMSHIWYNYIYWKVVLQSAYFEICKNVYMTK